MGNIDVFGIAVFRAISRSLHTGTGSGTPLVDCFLKVFIYETTLELQTSNIRGVTLRVLSCKLPISSKRRIREFSPPEVIGPDTFFFIFFFFLKPP